MNDARNEAQARMANPFGAFRNNIGVRLISLMLLLTLLPMIALGVFGRNSLQTALVDGQTRSLNVTRESASTELDNFLQNMATLVDFTSRADPIVRYANADGIGRAPFGSIAQDQLRRLIRLNPHFESAALVDLTGKIILDEAATGQANGIGTDVAFRDYFQAAAAGRPFISAPAISVISKKGAFFVSTPVYDPNLSGKVVAVVRLRVSDDALTAILQGVTTSSGDTVAQGGRLTLLDEDGIVVAQVGRAAVLAGEQVRLQSFLPVTQARLDAIRSSRRFGTADVTITQLPTSQNFRDAVSGQAEVKSFIFDFNGQPHYGAVARLKTTNWAIVADQSEAAILAPVGRQTQTFLLLGLVIAALAAFAAFVTARQITRPVDQMARVARRIAAGDYSSRMPEAGEDQFANLGRTVNTMVGQIVTNTQQQEAQNAAMQTQIVRLLEEVSSVAEGDLTVEAVVSADALGAVADSFNYMIAELRQVIGRVNGATQQVGRSTDEILTTTDALSRSAEDQAARIADTSTAVEEMAVSIQQVSENATISAQVARQARTSAEAGTQAVVATVEGMGRIRGQVQETAKKIKRLGESSQEIGQAVQLIEGIAKRTNRLALNAAIQAAMAGEQGKGFAVVAEEVRRLAERTTAATGQIAELVSAIQSETSEAVIAMEEGTREVVNGSRLADEAGRSLGNIDQIVGQLAELIEAISLAADQQARASAGIARAMGELSTVTQGTAVGSQQAAASVATLAALADDLRTSVATFRLEADTPPSANGHGQTNGHAPVDTSLVLAGAGGRHMGQN